MSQTINILTSTSDVREAIESFCQNEGIPAWNSKVDHIIEEMATGYIHSNKEDTVQAVVNAIEFFDDDDEGVRNIVEVFYRTLDIQWTIPYESNYTKDIRHYHEDDCIELIFTPVRSPDPTVLLKESLRESIANGDYLPEEWRSLAESRY